MADKPEPPIRTGIRDHIFRRPSENPDVIIGLRLTVEPPTLSATCKEAFYLVLTARVIKTPNPSVPITFATFRTPFFTLYDRSFRNIVGLDSSGELQAGPDAKYIRFWPYGWAKYIHPENPNLAKSWTFLTVPPPGQGVLTFKHEVPSDLIKSANVQNGERYRAQMTNQMLGTDWWTYGDLEGKRPRMWVSSDKEESDDESQAKAREVDYYDFEGAAELRKPESEFGVWERGEDPHQFAFEIEEDGRAGVVDFDVKLGEITVEGLKISDEEK